MATRANTLDICVPYYGPQEYLEPLLESIRNNTSIPFRLIVGNDCNGAETTDLVREWASAHKVEKLILFKNGKRKYFAECANQCLSHSEAEFAAVVHPSVSIDDPDWFPKMTMPFKDAQCPMVGVDPMRAWNTSRPIQLTRRSEPVHRCLVVIRRPTEDFFNTDIGHNPMMKTQRRIFDARQRVWLAPSVRVSLRAFQADGFPTKKGMTSKTELVIET